MRGKCDEQGEERAPVILVSVSAATLVSASRMAVCLTRTRAPVTGVKGTHDCSLGCIPTIHNNCVSSRSSRCSCGNDELQRGWQ